MFLSCKYFIRQVKFWLHNHGCNKKSKDVIKYVQQWNVRQVVGVLHQKEVEELCCDHSNAVPGEKEYLKAIRRF
jgi:hypothetical protein